MCLRRDQGLLGGKKLKNSDLEEKMGRTWKRPKAGPTHLQGSDATGRSSAESTALQVTGRCPSRVPSRPF